MEARAKRALAVEINCRHYSLELDLCRHRKALASLADEHPRLPALKPLPGALERIATFGHQR
jgi:hypothetical protein